MTAPVQIPQEDETIPLPRNPAARTRVAGLLLMAALMFGWAVSWPATKIALNEIPPLLLRTITLSSGGLGLLLLAKGLGFRLRIEPRELKAFALMALFSVTGWQVCMAYGVYLMPAGRASIIGNTIPIWVALLGVWILRERLTRFVVLGITSGAVGLLVLIGRDITLVKAAPLGAMFMLAAAVSAAIGVICIKLRQWETPLPVLAGWSVLLGGVPVYIATVVTGQSPHVYPPSTPALLATAYNVIIPTIFAQWGWLKLITLFPATAASAVVFVVPIIAVSLSSLWLGERFGWQELISLGLVLLGLFWVLFAPSLFRTRE